MFLEFTCATFNWFTKVASCFHVFRILCWWFSAVNKYSFCLLDDSERSQDQYHRRFQSRENCHRPWAPPDHHQSKKNSGNLKRNAKNGKKLNPSTATYKTNRAFSSLIIRQKVMVKPKKILYSQIKPWTNLNLAQSNHRVQIKPTAVKSDKTI